MSDFDRTDACLTALTGALMIAALMLYPHFWVAMAIFAVGCNTMVARHIDWKWKDSERRSQRERPVTHTHSGRHANR